MSSGRGWGGAEFTTIAGSSTYPPAGGAAATPAGGATATPAAGAVATFVAGGALAVPLAAGARAGAEGASTVGR